MMKTSLASLFVLSTLMCGSVNGNRNRSGVQQRDEEESRDMNIFMFKDERRTLSEHTCDETFCSNGENCRNSRCAGCDFNCSGQCPAIEMTCAVYCDESKCSEKICSSCQFCSYTKVCPKGTFDDVTDSMFSSDKDYWYSFGHSGMPYPHQSAPLFVDLNGDGILDYFNSMHGHKFDKEKDKDGIIKADRMELAISVSSESATSTVLHSVAERIIFEGDDTEDFLNRFGVPGVDTHGQNILDLDGDGILDLYIAQGGAQGKPMSKPAIRDNMLLFGELDENGNTVFRGGRAIAEQAGVNMQNGRGRFNYMLDVNGDGLIDIFCLQSRRKDNLITPGVLLINQGNRTWVEDDSMQEFANTMILTDADGDGVANEIMIVRGNCFPQREDPDPDYPEFGPFSEEVINFCATRPVGSTAIYKYDPSPKRMVELTASYYKVTTRKNLQPPCCPLGGFDVDCSAVSIASSDFDNDRVADQVVLHKDRLTFYFSSDRERGELPVNDKKGLVVELPDYCGAGKSVRVVDIDNDSKVEVLVFCTNPGAFAIYREGMNSKKWILHTACNDNSSLGDMNDISLAYGDFNALFAGKDCSAITGETFRRYCLDYQENGKKFQIGATGLTMVDMNNDGFLDAVVSNNVGYLRFFHNNPSPLKRDNKFIKFILKGNGSTSNVYGIGATVTLFAKQKGLVRSQVKEISHHQHVSDNTGSSDDRISFGLGKNLKPIRVQIVWPNKKKQILSIKDWSFSTQAIELLDYSDLSPFKIRRAVSTEGQASLCLSTGRHQDGLRNKIELKECSTSGILREFFTFDKRGRLRSLRYKKYCVEPMKSTTGFSQIQMQKCSTNSKSKNRRKQFLFSTLKAAKEEAETAKYWQEEAEKELLRYQEQEKLIKQAEQDAEEQKRLRMEAEQRNAARIAALEEERQREAARIEEEVRLRLAAEEEAARQKQIEEERLRYEAKMRIEEKLRLKAEAEEEERMRAEVEAAQAMAAEKERQRIEADVAQVAPVEESVVAEEPPAVVETEEVESTVVENAGEPTVQDMPMAESTDTVEEVEVATPPTFPAAEFNPEEVQVPEPTAAVFEVHDADSIVLDEVDDTPVDTAIAEDAWLSFNEPEIREKKSNGTPDVNEEGWETATPEKEVTSATKQSNWETFNAPELVKQVKEEVNITPVPKKRKMMAGEIFTL